MGDLRDRADIEHMEERHPPERLRHYLTQSGRGLVAELIRMGHTESVVWGDSDTLPTTPADSGAEDFLEVAFPAGIELFGFDVNNGSKWYSLDRIGLSRRRDFTNVGGLPQAYLIQTLPKTNPAASPPAVTPGIIQVYPASTLGLTYRLLYIEAFPELTKNSQVIYGYDGDWLEWITWDAAIKVLFKDDEMDPTQESKALRERAKIEARMAVNINRMDRGPITPKRAGTGRIARRRFSSSG